MLTGLLLAAVALASLTVVTMLPREHWWGVMNDYGAQMPFDERTVAMSHVRLPYFAGE